MRKLIRPASVVVALGWLAAWCGVLLLLWRPAYEARVELADFSASGDITASGMGRLAATGIALAAILIGLPVLVAALLPRRGKGLQREHAAETSALVPLNDEMGGERLSPPVAERPISLRPRGNEVPAAAVAERHDELESLRTRLDQQEQEVRRLREMVTQLHATPAEGDERQPAPNGRM